MNLFSTETRKKLSTTRYWELCETYSRGSLQLVLAPSAAQLHIRLKQLIDAEVQFGFAYDAEKIWLEEILKSAAFENYPDWLLRNINQHLFDQPLLWGVHNGSGLYSINNHNIWSANIDLIKTKGYSFALTDDDDIASFSTYFTLSVYGERDRPSPAHLVHAFRRLFNAPYHLKEIKHRLICLIDDTNSDERKTSIKTYYSIEIETAERENPTHWLLGLSNHYGSWEDIDFIKNLALPFESRSDPIRELFEENRFPEWRPSKDNKYQHIPARLVNKYRTNLNADVYSDYERQLHSKYAYLRQFVDCQCGENSLAHLQFQWGQLANFIEYSIGDEISWDGEVLGYPELETVYVIATADMKCTACERRLNDVLICIRKNRIHSLQPNLLKNIKYTFQGPFISDNLVSWKDYQSDWIKKQWGELMENTQIDEFNHCVLPNLTDGVCSFRNENIKYLYLISKYRHSIPLALFERCVLQRPINIYNTTSKQVTLDSQLKTCAILHATHNDKIKLVKFYWGDLLNFPEYEVGDTIKWSKYATGEKFIEEVVYARGYIDEDHSSLVIIEINSNQIVNIHFDYDKLDTARSILHENAPAYFGENWLPWMVMPDNKFIASRIPK